MHFLKYFIASAALVSLTACGEPMSQSGVKSQYSGHTVSKLTSEQRYQYLGPNDPSLGTRYIYHAPDGRAYYFKQTQKNYRRSEAGKWWSGDNKICYSMRVTRAEDPEGDQCAPAGTDALWSSFERGDTQGLAPKRAPNRSTNTRQAGSNSNQTTRCEGFNTITGCPGGFWDTVVKAAPTVIAGAAVVGAIGNQVCGPGGCSGTAPSGGYSAPSSNTTSNTGSSSSSSSASAPRGVKRIENWGKSPDGSSPQYKITCHNGTTHRYWRQSGEWWGPFGSVGLNNWDRNRLASDRCR